MEKKITIKEFVEKYVSLQGEKSKDAFIDSHMIKDAYVDIEEKIYLCDAIIKASSTHIGDDGIEIYDKNSVLEYMSFSLVMINNYTDIDADVEDFERLEIYNLLDKNNLIDKIIAKIPQTELEKMNFVLKARKQDYYDNNRSMPSVIESAISTFTSLMVLATQQSQ